MMTISSHTSCKIIVSTLLAFNLASASNGQEDFLATRLKVNAEKSKLLVKDIELVHQRVLLEWDRYAQKPNDMQLFTLTCWLYEIPRSLYTDKAYAFETQVLELISKKNPDEWRRLSLFASAKSNSAVSSEQMNAVLTRYQNDPQVLATILVVDSFANLTYSARPLPSGEFQTLLKRLQTISKKQPVWYASIAASYLYTESKPGMENENALKYYKLFLKNAPKWVRNGPTFQFAKEYCNE